MAPDGTARIGSSLPRRRFLALGGAALATAALPACAGGAAATPVGPRARPVEAAEEARRAAGARVVETPLIAAPGTVDLGGVQVRTWLFNGQLPGPEIRVRRGDVVRAELRNELPQSTTIHWHGIALRNDMDGVPDLTQSPVSSQTRFTYEFTVPDPGSYIYHSHFGTQLDRGLYGPLVVDDPDEVGDYDAEAVIVLDDWLDGVAGDPDRQLEQLRNQGMSMDDMGMGAMGADPGSAPLGPDAGDVEYPYYLINGRTPTDPITVQGRPGQRLRLRLLNVGSDTAFRVALGGHRLTVTHADGFPVELADGDAVLVGMGERYDLLVTLADGAFPLVAAAEGKQGRALAVVRTGAGAPPTPDAAPAELAGRLITAGQLRAAEQVRLPRQEVGRTHVLNLGMSMGEYRWTINKQVFGEHDPLPVEQGERTRLRFVNRTMMFHPMHLHGHTFQLTTGSGAGPRKDTAIVLPMQAVEVDVQADNPGQWLVHCHNVYHQEAGMATVLSYVG